MSVQSKLNTPRERASASFAVDSHGEAYVFGGLDTPGGTTTPGGLPSAMNDLVKFNATGLSWVWLAGSTAYNRTGVYGTLGVAATANTPSARAYAASAMDSKNRLWVFGGVFKVSVTPNSERMSTPLFFVILV